MTQASALLQRCGGDTKTAIVAQQCGVSPQDAQRLLAAAGGQLRGALESANRGRRAPGRLDSPGTECRAVQGRGADSVSGRSSRSEHPGRDQGSEVRRPISFWESTAAVRKRSLGWRVPTAVNCRLSAAAKRDHRTRKRPAGPPRWTTSNVRSIAPCWRRGRAERGFAPHAWPWPARDATATGNASRTGRGAAASAEQVLVTHDALPVLAAGTPDGVGVAVISGTGSLAFGRNAAGQTARAGGWGYLIGDEGSGYAIARQALQAAARAWDGRGPQTALSERLLAELGLAQPSELVHAVYGRQQDRHWLAGLARVAVEAADAGDPIACRIIDEAAADLAAMCVAVAKQLGFSLRPRAAVLGVGRRLAGQRRDGERSLAAENTGRRLRPNRNPVGARTGRRCRSVGEGFSLIFQPLATKTQPASSTIDVAVAWARLPRARKPLPQNTPKFEVPPPDCPRRLCHVDSDYPP